QPSLRGDLGDSRGTVALRIPDSAEALEILADNGPLAVSSANLTGQPPATTIEEARGMLSDAVDIYLDAGPMPGALTSTIVDATDGTLRIVREGVVSLERLREIVPTIESSAT
ncbi:MAG: L-threonylcarbamoyladenylate synthase, partial [Nocardioidaceae bacterium]